MFATGLAVRCHSSAFAYLIAVPTGIKFFNWLGDDVRGPVTFADADAVLAGSSSRFCSAASLVSCWRVRRSTSTFTTPTSSSRISTRCCSARHLRRVRRHPLLVSEDDRPDDGRAGGKLHFWLTFVGFHMTFLVQHLLGNIGMPRRYADYLPSDGFTVLNTVSTVGAFIVGASMLPFFWNVWKSYRLGRVVAVDDPWGFGASLEWATSCPPPRHNFLSIPRIRSERPAFDRKYPEYASTPNAEHGSNTDENVPRRGRPHGEAGTDQSNSSSPKA